MNVPLIIFPQLPVSVGASYSKYVISATPTLQEGKKKEQSTLQRLTYFNQSTLMQHELVWKM